MSVRFAKMVHHELAYWRQGTFMQRPDDTFSSDEESDDEDDFPHGGDMQFVPGTDSEGNSLGVWTHNGVPFFGVMHGPGPPAPMT